MPTVPFDTGEKQTVEDLVEDRAGRIVASGVETLTASEATVDTGVTAGNRFYRVLMSPRGCDAAVSIEDDSGGTGNIVLHLEENTTSVGNPDVGWALELVEVDV